MLHLLDIFFFALFVVFIYSTCFSKISRIEENYYNAHRHHCTYLKSPTECLNYCDVIIAILSQEVVIKTLKEDSLALIKAIKALP